MPAYLYYSVFLVVLILMIVFGLVSATHFKIFSAQEKTHFNKAERRLLKLPDVWLSSSMWLLYINNAVTILSVVCSLIIIVMVAYDSRVNPANIIVFTLLSLACSILANFTNGKEKAMAYRNAFTILNPVCEQYQNRYWSERSTEKDSREEDFGKLVEARAKGEAIIEDAHMTVFRKSVDPVIRLRSLRAKEENPNSNGLSVDSLKSEVLFGQEYVSQTSCKKIGHGKEGLFPGSMLEN